MSSSRVPRSQLHIVQKAAEANLLSAAVLAFLSKFWRCDVPARLEKIYCATVLLRHELIESHTTAEYKTFRLSRWQRNDHDG